MKTFKFSAFVVLTAMFFAACGDDVTKVTNVTHSESVRRSVRAR